MRCCASLLRMRPRRWCQRLFGSPWELPGSPLKYPFCRPPRRRDAHSPRPERTVDNRFTRSSRKCRFFRKHRGATWAPRRTTVGPPRSVSTETQYLTQTPVVQILTFGLRTPVAGEDCTRPLAAVQVRTDERRECAKGRTFVGDLAQSAQSAPERTVAKVKIPVRKYF